MDLSGQSSQEGPGQTIKTLCIRVSASLHEMDNSKALLTIVNTNSNSNNTSNKNNNNSNIFTLMKWIHSLCCTPRQVVPPQDQSLDPSDPSNCSGGRLRPRFRMVDAIFARTCGAVLRLL